MPLGSAMMIGTSVKARGGYSAAVLALSPLFFVTLGDPLATASTPNLGSLGGTLTYKAGVVLGSTPLLTDAPDSATTSCSSSTGIGTLTGVTIPTPLTAGTWCWWAKATTLSGYEEMFDLNAGGAVLVGYNSADLSVYSNADPLTSGGALTATTQFIAITYDGSTWTGYINGVSAGTHSSSTHTAITGSSMLLGTDTYSEHTAGKFCQEAWFATALSGAQIAALYTAGT